eukprot:355955-Chlamydomonas_euryale.AAC.5
MSIGFPRPTLACGGDCALVWEVCCTLGVAVMFHVPSNQAAFSHVLGGCCKCDNVAQLRPHTSGRRGEMACDRGAPVVGDAGTAAPSTYRVFGNAFLGVVKNRA